MPKCTCPYCTRPGRPADFTDAEKQSRREYWFAASAHKATHPGRCRRGLHAMTPENTGWRYYDRGARPYCVACQADRRKVDET
jgi:hypothetical protein